MEIARKDVWYPVSLAHVGGYYWIYTCAYIRYLIRISLLYKNLNQVL